jgi:hypothetical protein
MKQKIFTLNIIILLCLYSFSCTHRCNFSLQKVELKHRAKLSSGLHKFVVSVPSNSNIELIYFCSIYEIKDKKNEIIKTCDCHIINKKNILDYISDTIPFNYKKRHHIFLNYDLLMTDKEFIFNEIYPLCDERTKRELEYSYSDNRDTIFKNIIDYEHKVILDETHYYYPVSLPRATFPIFINDYKWFLSVYPTNLWNPAYNCILDLPANINTYIYITVPTLEVLTLKEKQGRH